MRLIEVTPEEERLILKNRKTPTIHRVGYLKQNLYQYDDGISLELLSSDIDLMTLDEIERAKRKFSDHFDLAIPTGAMFSSILDNTGDEIWRPVDKKYLSYIEEMGNHFADKYLENISEV